MPQDHTAHTQWTMLHLPSAERERGLGEVEDMAGRQEGRRAGRTRGREKKCEAKEFRGGPTQTLRFRMMVARGKYLTQQSEMSCGVWLFADRGRHSWVAHGGMDP